MIERISTAEHKRTLYWKGITDLSKYLKEKKMIIMELIFIRIYYGKSSFCS